MRAAICDDSSAMIIETYAALKYWAVHSGTNLQISAFNTGEDLLDAHAHIRFDIIFLDINLPGLSGMDTARRIRAFDRDAAIVFLTSHPEHALEAFSVRAFHYLLKPLSFGMLTEVMEDFRILYDKTSKYLILHCNGTYLKRYLHEIAYLEVQSRHVHFHMKNGEIIVMKEPFHTYENILLTNPDFVKCHRSYIVSLPQVSSFRYDEITMENGDSIPLSRTFVKNFREKFSKYMKKNKMEVSQ